MLFYLILQSFCYFYIIYASLQRLFFFIKTIMFNCSGNVFDERTGRSSFLHFLHVSCRASYCVQPCKLLHILCNMKFASKTLIQLFCSGIRLLVMIAYSILFRLQYILSLSVFFLHLESAHYSYCLLKQVSQHHMSKTSVHVNNKLFVKGYYFFK